MTELVQVQYAGDRPEVIVRLAGRDQRVKPGGYVTATPAEAERLAEQPENWTVPEGRAGDTRNVEELRDAARDAGITGVSNLNRDQLLDALATAGENPIGAVGDAEAIAEANRIAAARPEGLAHAVGVQDETEPTIMRSSFDPAPEQAEVGAPSQPQPQDSVTAGEQGGVPGENPPAEVPTGRPPAAIVPTADLDREGLEVRASRLDVEGPYDELDDETLRELVIDAEREADS